MPNRDDIVAAIQIIVREKLDLPSIADDLGPETLLFQGGIGLDSFNIVELIGQLESQFLFEFEEADFSEENFRDIGALGSLVDRHVNGREKETN